MAALPLLQTVSTAYRFLPVEEAARVTKYTEAELRAGAETGTMLAGMLNGELQIAVTEDGHVVRIASAPDEYGDDINARLSQIKREDFAHLEGVEIGLSDAAREFGVSPQVIHRWVKRGYIKVLRTQGRRKYLDKGDVAFCVTVFRTRKPFGSRAPLLDAEGNPYLIKYPDLAKARRDTT